MSRTRLALAAGATLAAVLAVPAQAGETRTGTLVCDDGQTYVVEGNLYGSGQKLINSTQNFVFTYFSVRGGPVITKHSPGKERLDTLICTYTLSNKEGFVIDVEGFLTPNNKP